MGRLHAVCTLWTGEYGRAHGLTRQVMIRLREKHAIEVGMLLTEGLAFVLAAGPRGLLSTWISPKARQ